VPNAAQQQQLTEWRALGHDIYPLAFNGSLTNVYNPSVNKGVHDEAAKLAVITLFLLMAIGGIGGVMLAGYTFIVRGG
jgi:hypothetical protein